MVRPFAFAAAVGLALVFASCGSNSYPTRLADEKYDLEAMALQAGDLPEGFEKKQSASFDNEEWSQVFQNEDPEAKKRQLDAQGRVRNFIAIFSWEDAAVLHLGKPISLTAESTLFVDEKAASESTRTLCGLLMDDKDPIREFSVPRIGNQGSGFFVEGKQENYGKTIETNVCFRTGRIVHVISQSGLDGTQDVALSVSLAKKMLRRIDLVFDGKAPASTPESDQKGG
jgi:hypothetical protein